MKNNRTKAYVGRSAIAGGVVALLSGVLFTAPEGSAAELALRLSYLSLSNYSVAAPGTVTGTIKLTGPAPSDRTKVVSVSLQANNAGVVSLPATVQFLPMRDTAPFTITGVAPGCIEIIAVLDGAGVGASFAVHPPVTTTAFSLSVPNQVMYWGGQYNATFNTDGRFSGTVALSSSNSNVVSVPASIPVKTGQTSARIPLTVTGIGCARVTASVQGRTVMTSSRTVRVDPPPG
jgi:hypothetical protein